MALREIRFSPAMAMTIGSVQRDQSDPVTCTSAPARSGREGPRFRVIRVIPRLIEVVSRKQLATMTRKTTGRHFRVTTLGLRVIGDPPNPSVDDGDAE